MHATRWRAFLAVALMALSLSEPRLALGQRTGRDTTRDTALVNELTADSGDEGRSGIAASQQTIAAVEQQPGLQLLRLAGVT